MTDAEARAIEQFLFQEAALLDDRQYEEWVDLFTEDGRYWMPAGRDDSDPEKTTSLIYDDRQALRQRIARLFHPAAHSQTPPSRVCHVVGNVRIAEPSEGAGVNIASNFALFESRLGNQRVLGGRFEHTLRRANGSWGIVFKKVCLVNNDGVFNNLTFMF